MLSLPNLLTPCYPSPSPLTLKQAPVCDNYLPVSMCSHCSTPTYEREHAVFGFLFLCQFPENDGFLILPCPCKGHELIPFHGYVVFHGEYVPHFLYPVYLGWVFGWFQVFAIVNSAAINIRVHVSL